MKRKKVSLLLPDDARKGERAFSLVEVVIALAAATFCLMAILGLLVVGANTAQNSRRETRAAYVAEQVVSDLRAYPFTNATILYQNSSTGTLQPLSSFSLASAATNYLTFDGQNDVLSTATAGQYTSGLGSANAAYLVQITVLPTVLGNLSSVSVEVSAPVQAALASRSRYGFQTMIGNRQ